MLQTPKRNKIFIFFQSLDFTLGVPDPGTEGFPSSIQKLRSWKFFMHKYTKHKNIQIHYYIVKCFIISPFYILFLRSPSCNFNWQELSFTVGIITSHSITHHYLNQFENCKKNLNMFFKTRHEIIVHEV